MIHVHRLAGCAPTPLAHYLKAIGILRLVSEQADPQARGWWDGEQFRLATTLDAEDLEALFLEKYEPTPLLAPWNGASGFFKTWDGRAKKLRKSKNADALETLLTAKSPRWQRFRDAYQVAIDAVAQVLREINVDELSPKERSRYLIVPKGAGPVFPVADKDNDKATVQQSMIRNCGNNDFYRSAIVDMGNAAPGYPSLWGSGGNDGAIDFTARFFENLIIALIDNTRIISRNWLRSALNAVATSALLSGKKGKVGQFLPASAGGANCIVGPGSQDDTILNPWDFILMIEGAIVFTAHTTRRLDTGRVSRAAAPFALNAQGAGYASAADADESLRGEQWMPLWQQPFRLAELRRLLAEGRAQIGPHPSREPLDLARAIVRLGTARGISAFQRFGYIVRNGQANLAVPLGRFDVPEQATTQLECLDDLAAWLVRLRREARDKKAPARLAAAEGQLSNALFAVTQHPTAPRRWQRVLLDLAAIEAVQVSGSGFKPGPIPTLRPGWVKAADDGEPSLRLALALALQTGGFEGTDAPWWNSVRRHWLPLDRKRPDRFAQTVSAGHRKLLTGPETVIRGRSGSDDALALVARRLVEGAQHGKRSLPLHAAVNSSPRNADSAESADLSALIAGEVDLDQTMALARAFMALDRRSWYRNPPLVLRAAHWEVPDDAWIVLRLALLPFPIRLGAKRRIEIDSDPSIFRRLASGDADTAVAVALRRLRAAGIRTAVRATSLPSDTARDWAAALAFPIHPSTAMRYLRRLDPSVDLTKED